MIARAPWRPTRRFHYTCLLLACFAVSGADCPPRPRPVIKANDTFMLAYIDSNEKLRVRWSSDGYRWEDGELDARGVFDNGIGAASSDDVIGATRLLAYPSLGGRLTIRMGLGSVFDGTDRSFDNVFAGGPPSVAYASTNHWLITTVGGSQNQQGLVHDWDASARVLTPVTPSGLAGLQNNRLVRPPQIAARGGRVVASWMRWTPSGVNRLPGPVQLVAGNAQANGAVQWTNVVDFAIAEPGFGDPLTDPALTHDGARFLLGVVRRAGSDQRVFIYQSTDGVSWQSFDSLSPGTSSEVFTVRLAAHDGGNMLVGITRAGGADFSRKFRGEWQNLRHANVFGTQRESSWGMSLIAPGKRRSPIIVNGENADAPWSGTETDPYRTIQEAFNRAGRGDTVIVQGGYYRESITMNPGTILQSRGTTPLIDSPGNDPTIRARGDNVIENVIVECNVACIEVQVEQALAGLQSDGSSAYVNVVRSWPRSGAVGVAVVGSDTFDFGTDHVRLFNMRVLGSRVSSHFGAGLLADLRGPSRGSLHVALDVRDNTFEGNGAGIQLEMEGGGPNTGGFTRAQYSGFVHNNLIFGGRNGIFLDATNAGAILTHFTFNTIARASEDGIIAGAESGPNGLSRVSARLFCNIVAENGRFGYVEFTERTAPLIFERNIFSNNRDGHYVDSAERISTTTAQLNSATQNATNNLVADPLFVADGFRWTPNNIDFGEVGDFFLRQDSTSTSPAVNRCGPSSVELNKLQNHTTRTDYVQDSAAPDTGWHYPRN